jgi:hypothetical protein
VQHGRTFRNEEEKSLSRLYSDIVMKGEEKLNVKIRTPKLAKLVGEVSGAERNFHVETP